MRTIKDPGLFKTIRYFVESYSTSIKSQSFHTQLAYKKSIDLYLCFLKVVKNRMIWSITRNDFNRENILEFLQWLEKTRDNSPTTINLRLSMMKSLCSYLSDEGIIPLDVMAKIQQVKKKKTVNKEPIEGLTIEQIKHILSLPNTRTEKGLRDLCFMTILYDSGCRDNELLTLKLKNIKFENQVADIKVEGKGNKVRVIPLTADAVRILKKYISVYHEKYNFNQFLFYTVIKGELNRMSDDNAARILMKYEKMTDPKLKIPHLHPHLFRHTRAIHLYRAGMPLPLVCEWLGHSQIETTFIYAFANAEMKRKAIESAANQENTFFDNEEFSYGDEEVIKRLYSIR